MAQTVTFQLARSLPPLVKDRDYPNFQLFERRFRSATRKFHVDRSHGS